MAKPSSTTDRVTLSRRSRRGYSLMEGMIASVLLAGSVVGVTGTILSSMAHDRYSRERSAAMRSGSLLMDEVAALPVTTDDPTRVSLMDFVTYSDQTDAAASVPVVPSLAKTKKASGENGDELTEIVEDVVGPLEEFLGENATSTAQPAHTTLAASSNSYMANRSVTVKRYSGVNGSEDANGDIAIVSVNVTGENGGTVTIKRLVTVAEGQANAN